MVCNYRTALDAGGALFKNPGIIGPAQVTAGRSATGDGFLINNYDEQRNAVSKMQR